MGWIVKTPPATEPITLSEAKNHLKVDFTADDALITGLIAAARQYSENYTNLQFITQTIEEKFDAFKGRVHHLSAANLDSVAHVKYLDADGIEQTFSSGKYLQGKHGWPPFIALKSDQNWPTVLDQKDAITIEYSVGFGSSSDVPEAIKSAMLLIIGDMYENRMDKVKRLPTAAELLLNQYRKGF